MTKSATPSNKPYWRKIIKSSIIAFVLFLLGGSISNTGWASDIAVAALTQAVTYLIGAGLFVAALAAIAAGLLTLAKKNFMATFSSAYSVTIIVIAAIILFGSFP